MSSEPLSDRLLMKGDVSVSMGTEAMSERERQREKERERDYDLSVINSFGLC